MIESCFGSDLNVQHATDYMGTYLMYLWAINVIVIIDCFGLLFEPWAVPVLKLDPLKKERGAPVTCRNTSNSSISTSTSCNNSSSSSSCCCCCCDSSSE